MAGCICGAWPVDPCNELSELDCAAQRGSQSWSIFGGDAIHTSRNQPLGESHVLRLRWIQSPGANLCPLSMQTGDPVEAIIQNTGK